MATSLLSDNCRKVSKAPHRFATEKGLIVLRPSRSCGQKFHFTVPSGCYALVTSNGKDLDYIDRESGTKSAVWPPGLHFPHAPWVRVSHLITQQYIVFNLSIKACKTKDNCPINVDVSVTFRFMGDPKFKEDSYLLRKFVHEIKPRGLEQQLRDLVEDLIRMWTKRKNSAEIYGLRSKQSKTVPHIVDANVQHDVDCFVEHDDFDDDLSYEEGRSDFVISGSSSDNGSDDGKSTEENRIALRTTRSGKANSVTYDMAKRMNRQFVLQGIKILSISLKDITIPKQAQEQMQEKTMKNILMMEQAIHHHEDMQRTKMEQEIQTLLQTLREQKSHEVQSGLEIISREKLKLNDSKAFAEKSEAAIKEEIRVYVDQYFAKNAYEIEQLRSSTDADIKQIESKTKSMCIELLANTKYECEQSLGDAQAKASINDAQSEKILAHAEGIIAKWLSEKKDFDINMRRIKIEEKLADNDGLIIGAFDDECINSALVADSILESKEKDEEGFYAHTVAAEMLLLKMNA